MRALITGVTGQDGKLLSKLLYEKNYEVYGLVRRIANRKYEADGVSIIEGDIRDNNLMEDIISKYKFDEIYHLASISDVAYSFEHPNEVYDINISGTLNLLNALRKSPDTKFYFAGTSEMFGKPKTKPQTEDYPMEPVSPYGVSKLAGYWSSNLYRKAYGLKIYCGILYNHESVYRPDHFVSAKIIKGVKRFYNVGTGFNIGNMNALKDWGYAPEYVEGMYRMLKDGVPPDNYILATMEQHSVFEFIVRALEEAGIEYHIREDDDGNPKQIIDANSYFPIVSQDSHLFRPNEADNYCGSYAKAKEIFGWEPKVKFKELVKKLYVEFEEALK